VGRVWGLRAEQVAGIVVDAPGKKGTGAIRARAYLFGVRACMMSPVEAFCRQSFLGQHGLRRLLRSVVVA
jgi:hypothetical protein